MKIADLSPGSQYLLRSETREEQVVYVGREDRPDGRRSNRVVVRTVSRGVELIAAPSSLHPVP